MIEMSAPGRAEVDGMMITMDDKGSISSISAGIEPCHVRLDFSPGFPNLLEIPDRGSAAGKWKIQIAGVNITGGSYSALRDGNRATVELDVTENWKPSGLPLSMEIFTRAVPVFRTWPATYRWRGVVGLGMEPVMSGTWERKEGRTK
ncbi:MAG TPA: hypothetical protein HA257_08030 [Candidatus Methanoperedenaceae archaeon]|nr:hypothetical protein [Candidatus Methanoperedenaceae archaeon]